jgi:hypothetical protein
MSTTWKSIKLATLQKMFASNGTSIQADSSTTEYINAMPQAANEALQRLSTAGKFIVKEVHILLFPVDNLIPDEDGMKNYSIIDNSLSFTVQDAKSYYFKAAGTLTATIKVGNTTFKSITVSNTVYTVYKGLITNNAGEDVTITFAAAYPSNVKNIALYTATFASDDDVAVYEEYIRYKLSDICTDFYQLDSGEIYYASNSEPKYIASDNYYQEADKTLVFQRDMPGEYTVYYKAYPTQITLSTPDTYEMELDPEVAALVPMYMASQIYKDDDNSIATVYRNEFEIALQSLSQGASVPKNEEFVSESGWCS